MGRRSKAPNSRPRRRSRFKQVLLGLGIGLPALALGLFVLANKVEWVGPLMADSLRAVVGTRAVARLEDFAYGVEDRWNQVWKKNDKPKAYWQVPSAHARPRHRPKKVADKGPPPLPPFEPKDVGAMHKNWSAPGDGVWVAIDDPRHPDDDPHLFKTLIHPDKNRSWAELFVVAIDLRRTELKLVAGSREPKSNTVEGRKYERPALIARKDVPDLLAAFNGGFKTEHGHYGMKVDGVALLRPRKRACVVADYKDDTIKIGAWKDLGDSADDMQWYRQTPGCMYDHGKMHVGLRNEDATAWGATLDGDTVIRRSAIGIDKTGKILYVGISNHTSAPAIAEGMHFAGATSVAQLDVNWSYPKFVLYRPGDDGKLEAKPLADGFEFSKDEYLRQRSRRDFFYLVRKDNETARR